MSFILKIKLTFVFLIMFSSLGYGQTIESIFVNFDRDNALLTEILEDIGQRYEVNIYYNEEWFQNERVSLKVANVSLENMLKKLINELPYTFIVIQGQHVVFLPREEVAIITGKMDNFISGYTGGNMEVIGEAKNAGRYEEVELSGIIRDGKTGKPLPGATVTLENTTTGAVTNAKGRYSITLKPGKYTLNASSIGFNDAKVHAKVISSGLLNIELFEKTLDIREVAVYAQKADQNLRKNQMSMVELDIKNIEQLPSMIGDKDIIKGLTMMPGVKSVGEFGSGINVRGGSEDQNLYLVEGAPLFNTSHVFGLLSVINPDLVSKLKLYKGHIPAYHGQRVSSIMDIEIKNNMKDRLSSRGGIGLYNSRLSLEGSPSDNISFKIGGRSSYSDWLLQRIQDYYLQNSSASFHDLTGVINLHYSKDKMTFFGYKSYDKFKYANELNYEYGNLLSSISWNHFFGENLVSGLTIAYSQYDVINDDIGELFEKNRTTSFIKYWNGKYNLSWNGLRKHKMNSGISFVSYNVLPGKQIPLDNLSLIQPKILSQENAYEGAVYINDLYRISEKFSVNAGLRISFYVTTGPLTKPVYAEGRPYSSIGVIDSVQYKNGEIITEFFHPEPRISVKYQIDDKKSVKLSFARNSQYITRISYTSVPTPDDVWKLSDNYLKPLLSNQFALGYYQNYMNNGIETSLELYYKKVNNVRTYKNDAKISMYQHVETELINAMGRNYGAEMLIRKNAGKIEGWISYTYSRSVLKTNGKFPENIINSNHYYPSSYDKPHDLKIVMNYHFNKRLRISGNFSFMSGRSVSLPEYEYNTGSEKVIFYSDRNKYRLPPYHRLDLSISIDESLRIRKKWKGSWTFSILNVYARNNAYSVFYKKETPNITNDYKAFSLYKMYIIGKPLPTITYNFIF